MGDPVARGRGRRRFSVWSIQDSHGSAKVEARLARILERVSGVADRIGSIAADPRIHSVSLWVWSAGEEFGLELSKSQLQGIARLGASLKVDVYERGSESENGGNGGLPRWREWWDYPSATA
jgi:hypothetical protein